MTGGIIPTVLQGVRRNSQQLILMYSFGLMTSEQKSKSEGSRI